MPEIALHIMDLVQNCISAMASRIGIFLNESVARDCLELIIADDGKGMSEEFLKNVTSPFTTTRTTRRVGMGIPLLKAGCEATGGSFSIESTLGKGTRLAGTYVFSNIDRPPVGDFIGTVHTLIVCNPTVFFHIGVSTDDGTFDLDTEQMREQLGDLPINDPAISAWIKEYMEEGIKELNITD